MRKGREITGFNVTKPGEQMDRESPLVSIVTPSLNQGRFIEETILSVKNQTYPHIEHIVVDGSSTDETLGILRKYSDSITWISEPDEGQSDAINKGWRMCNGQILAYLNADDTYMPSSVQTAVEFFTRNPDVSMVYGDCNLIDEQGRMTGKYPTREFHLQRILCALCPIPQPAVFFRKVLLDEVGYLDTRLHMAMDLDLWIRIGMKFVVQHIPEVLASFRLYPGTKSLSEKYRFSLDRLTILDKVYSDLKLPREVKSLRRRAYSYAHFEAGLAYYQLHQMKEARRHLLWSIVLSPMRMRARGMPTVLIRSFLHRKS